MTNTCHSRAFLCRKLMTMKSNTLKLKKFVAEPLTGDHKTNNYMSELMLLESIMCQTEGSASLYNRRSPNQCSKNERFVEDYWIIL